MATPKMVATETTPEDLQQLEMAALKDRVELLQAENERLRNPVVSRQHDPKARAIAAQMLNDDENKPRNGVVHISEFDKADIMYRGREEDVTQLLGGA